MARLLGALSLSATLLERDMFTWYLQECSAQDKRPRQSQGRPQRQCSGCRLKEWMASEGGKKVSYDISDPHPIWQIQSMVELAKNRLDGAPLGDIHCGERDGYRMGMRNGLTLKSKIGRDLRTLFLQRN